MGETAIEWTDEVWNPVTGCTKISPGCKNCYAAEIAKRFWGDRPFTDVRCHPDRLDQPLHWKRPRRVFVNSMSDLFHEDVPEQFIDRVRTVMALAPRHTFQVLTKRAGRMYRSMMRRLSYPDFIQLCGSLPWRYDDPDSVFDSAWMRYKDRLPNLQLGVSCENQKALDERVPELLLTPAAVHFVSLEPLLGSVSLRWLTAWPENAPTTAMNPAGATDHLDGLRRLDWVIVGAESGPRARPMDEDWVRSIRDQCQEAGVPFFYKQRLENGRRVTMPELDGKVWDEYPA